MEYRFNNFFGNREVTIRGLCKFVDYIPWSEWGSGEIYRTRFSFKFIFPDHTFGEDWKERLIEYLKDRKINHSDGLVKHLRVRNLTLTIPISDSESEESGSDYDEFVDTDSE